MRQKVLILTADGNENLSSLKTSLNGVHFLKHFLRQHAVPYEIHQTNDESATLNHPRWDSERQFGALLICGEAGAAGTFLCQPALQDLIQKAWEDRRIICGIDHGCLAFMESVVAGGQYLVKGLALTGPRWCQQEFVKRGAIFKSLPLEAPYAVVSASGRFITGQCARSYGLVGRRLLETLLP